MEAAGEPQDSAADRRKRAGTHSGRLLLRMPESLHAELARASDRAGSCLNGYINDALAEAVGRRPVPARPSSPREPARPGRRRFVERLLVVNLVVVAAVGALVVVLLVQAIR
jgi:hypothetical protein